MALLDYDKLIKSLQQGKQSELSTAACDPQEPVEQGPHCPCPDKCAGCYAVGELSGRELFIHPPKASVEWEAWLKRWEPKGPMQ